MHTIIADVRYTLCCQYVITRCSCSTQGVASRTHAPRVVIGVLVQTLLTSIVLATGECYYSMQLQAAQL
jgi:hypothetical protein